MIDTATCSHKEQKVVFRWFYDDYSGEEYERREVDLVYTYEDIDTGRFRCTQCGTVMYYTGLWKKFWEEGVPCAGSQNINREQELRNTK